MILLPYTPPPITPFSELFYRSPITFFNVTAPIHQNTGECFRHCWLLLVVRAAFIRCCMSVNTEHRVRAPRSRKLRSRVTFVLQFTDRSIYKDTCRFSTYPFTPTSAQNKSTRWPIGLQLSEEWPPDWVRSLGERCSWIHRGHVDTLLGLHNLAIPPQIFGYLRYVAVGSMLGIYIFYNQSHCNSRLTTN